MAASERKPMSALVIVLIVVVIVGAVAAAVAFVFLAGFVPFNQVAGSGTVETRTEDHIDFTKVTVTHAFAVEITQASSYLVRITLDDNLFQHLEVFKTGETLTIRLQSGFSYASALGRSLTLQAEITMPDLVEVQLSGATVAVVDGFSVSHPFVAGISSASRLQGTYTTTGDASLTLSGASTIELNGAAGDLTAAVSGASRLELTNFLVHNASVEMSGASRGTVNLDGRLDANVSGASALLYIGNPTLGDINTSGLSTVAPKT
ncbi:MAG: head GIN domain-containing protein [Thermoplasmata archaeon]